MNLRLLKWLVQHRDVLLAVIAAAKKYKPDSPYISQWDVVDEIARIVIPVFEKEGTDIEGLAYSGLEYEEESVAAFAMGAEVSALGIDWQALVQVVIPILIAILKALSANE